MNLEGTKHEKAVLVVIAYIIGFTSGFIAFGITNKDVTPVLSEPTPAFVPSDYTPPTENPPEFEEAPVATEEIVSYEEGKLYAKVGAEKFVLSLQSNIMPKENVEGFSTQGIHESVPAYLASTDNKYIYFCEQQTADLNCTNFIFDSVNNVIQPVSFAGERLIITNEEAAAVRFEDGLLVVGEKRSISSEAPWKLQ